MSENEYFDIFLIQVTAILKEHESKFPKEALVKATILIGLNDGLLSWRNLSTDISAKKEKIIASNGSSQILQISHKFYPGKEFI